MLIRTLLVAMVLSFAACSGGSDCTDNVWVQGYNFGSEAVTVSIASTGDICSDGLRFTMQPQVGMPEHLESDVKAGDTVEYTVQSGPPSLMGQRLTCTVAPKGVELTYVRMEVTANNMMQCECGFEEYYVNNPLDSCQ